MTNKLIDKITQVLKDRGQTVSTAESCTGGYLAHLFTLKSGSSVYFKGSIVAYANTVKENLLDVSPRTIAENGVVSEAVVLEMARDVNRLIQTDYGIALSGIMGPSGGTVKKPVGMVCIAVASSHMSFAKTYLQAQDDRLMNIKGAAQLALELLFFALNGG